jgi:hypothetical protein
MALGQHLPMRIAGQFGDLVAQPGQPERFPRSKQMRAERSASSRGTPPATS